MKPFNITEALETQQQIICQWQGRAKKGETGAAAEVLRAIEGLKALQALMVPDVPYPQPIVNPRPFSEPWLNTR